MNPRQQLEKIRADLRWVVESQDLIVKISKLSNIKSPVKIHSISEALAFPDLIFWLEKNLITLDLSSFIDKPYVPLGIYFERLWLFVLTNYPEFELITHNLPVSGTSRTLGEFDFIYFCQNRQRYLHMETAVKFYLGVPSTENNVKSANNWHNWKNWIGPGCKDRLDIKLPRMINHQCRLSGRPEAKALLSTLGIDDIDPEICLKGFFFYPLDQAIDSPYSANNKHVRGFWVKSNEIKKLFGSFPGKSWVILTKINWFTPYHFDHEIPAMDQEALTHQLDNHFKTRQFPVMIASVESSFEMNGVQSSKIRQRVFIVPDNWPFTQPN